MKLGTENRRKTMVAVGLFALALVLFVRMVAGGEGSNNSAVRAANPAAGSQRVTRPPAARARGTAARNNPKPATAGSLLASLDPRLRLNLLKESESTSYAGAGRNIFATVSEQVIPRPIAPPITPPQARTPPPPPPPPPIPLKFFGFANEPGRPKKVFLAQGDDVFIAGQGEIVNRRYKVLKINPASVEIEDVLNNNRQTIPLTQG